MYAVFRGGVVEQYNGRRGQIADEDSDDKEHYTAAQYSGQSYKEDYNSHGAEYCS